MREKLDLAGIWLLGGLDFILGRILWLRSGPESKRNWDQIAIITTIIIIIIIIVIIITTIIIIITIVIIIIIIITIIIMIIILYINWNQIKLYLSSASNGFFKFD